jgi:hypothetical protein
MHGRSSKPITWCGRLLVGIALLFGAVSSSLAQADDVETIRKHMDHLRPLVGSWSADYEFHDKDGTIDVEPGTFIVSWVLDDSYLQVQAEHHRRDNPRRHRAYTTFITYDPVTKKYVCTYFYGRSSLRVTEDGLFDEQTSELRTSALIPLEDGKRDERVRNIFSLSGTDSLTLLHYNKYSDEPGERLQLVIKLRRSEPGTKSGGQGERHS